MFIFPFLFLYDKYFYFYVPPHTFIYMNPSTTDTAFSKEQYDNIYPDDINNHYWNAARNHIIVSTIRKYHSQEPLLEIGCGRGPFLAYVHEQGMAIKGIEIAEATPLPQVSSLIQTGTDALNVSNEWAAQFKTILLLDVIEHIEDPIAFLAEIKRKYKHVNRMIIAVPARMEIFSNYDVYCGHFRRYDLDMMTQHAKALDARLLHQQYFFHLLYYPALLLRKIKKDRNTTITPPRTFIGKIVHSAIAIYFRIEHSLFPKKSKGSSIIAVLGFDR